MAVAKLFERNETPVIVACKTCHDSGLIQRADAPKLQTGENVWDCVMPCICAAGRQFDRDYASHNGDLICGCGEPCPQDRYRCDRCEARIMAAYKSGVRDFSDWPKPRIREGC